jgi:hypothetical protein
MTMAVFHEIKKLPSLVNWFVLLIVMSVAPILLNPNSATLCYLCYSQDARPPRHHKVTFFSIGCLGNDCCPIHPIFWLTGMIFDLAGKGFRPMAHSLGEALLVSLERTPPSLRLAVQCTRWSCSPTSPSSIGVISLRPTLVIRYAYSCQMRGIG